MDTRFEKLSLLLLIICCFNSLFSQESVIDIYKIDDKVIFDGDITEQFWEDMTSFTTIQHVPVNGANNSEEAQIMIGYDDDNMYVGAKVMGADIRSPSKKRDEFSLTPDWIGVLLDGYNDKENALCFFTTPAGLRSDFAIFEDAIGDFPVNLDWNTFWDVKTKLHNDHWTLEMRIPFSSLQFQVEENEDVLMGLIVWRAIASKNEISTYPLIENEWGDFSHMKPSKAQRIRLKGVKPQKPIYITPYALAGVNRIVQSNAPFEVNTNEQIAGGLDIKYSLTSNLTLDATVNTDFAQVEADDAQVNLDRFDLFFPEKRQFFQERSSIFDVRNGGPNRVFYSRRIGIDEDGNLQKILGGVRLSGRMGNYDVGFINMASRNDNWSLRDNATVLRLRKKVFNENSYIGLIGTNKTDLNGEFNRVYGLDGIIRLPKSHLLQVKWNQSFSDNLNNKLLSFDNTRIFVNLEKTSRIGFNYDLAIGRMGDAYNAELGFENRTNFTSLFGILGYVSRAPSDSKIFQHEWRMFNFSFLKNDILKDETTNVGMSYTLSWKNGHRFNVFSYFRRERIFEQLNVIGDFDVDPGLYSINVWNVEYGSPGVRPYQYSVSFRGGDIFDAKFLRLEQNINWNVSPTFSFGAYYNYNPIFVNGWGNKSLDVHLGRLKFLYTINTQLSLNGFLQATSDGDVGLGNIRFRYNPREGVDLFVVYNNVVDLGLASDVESLARRRVPEQVAIAKFTYTFRI